MKSEFDVIVIGGGGSGLAAAASAAECGAEVLLLEKQSRLGGTTGIAVGSFTAAGNQFQRAAGFEDDALPHVEDAAQFAPAEIEAQNNDPLRRYFLGHAAETLDWLLGMGLRFHGPTPEPRPRPQWAMPRPGRLTGKSTKPLVFQLARGEFLSQEGRDQSTGSSSATRNGKYLSCSFTRT